MNFRVSQTAAIFNPPSNLNQPSNISNEAIPNPPSNLKPQSNLNPATHQTEGTKLTIGQSNQLKNFIPTPEPSQLTIKGLSQISGDLQSQVSGTCYDPPVDFSKLPGTRTHSFWEESQIARIYGMTEDYTPPKRSKTPFMIYAEQKREEILDEKPNVSLPELTREIARCWACLDNDQKQRFVEEAARDKERFIQEMRALPLPLYRNRRPRRRRDRRKPKKVLTPYMFFVKENRPRIMRENPTMSFLEVMREIGVRWARLQEDEKEPFKERSMEDKRRFLEEQEAFIRQRFAFPSNTFDQRLGRSTNLPRRPMTGFLCFAKEMRERMKKENPKLQCSELMRQIGIEWTRMIQEEKKKYDMLAMRDTERYEEDFINYKKRMQMDMPESQVVSNCSESFTELDNGILNSQISIKSNQTAKSLRNLAHLPKIKQEISSQASTRSRRSIVSRKSGSFSEKVEKFNKDDSDIEME